jgi:hypothetical protein
LRRGHGCGRRATSVEKILECEEDRQLWVAHWDNTLLGRMAWRGLRIFYPEMMTGLVAAAARDAAQSP